MERETSAQSSDEEMENYGKDEVINEGKDEEERRENDGDENDGDGEVIKSTSGSPGDDRP